MMMMMMIMMTTQIVNSSTCGSPSASVVVVVVMATKVVLHRLSAIDQEVILGAPSYGWDVGYRLRGSTKMPKSPSKSSK